MNISDTNSFYGLNYRSGRQMKISVAGGVITRVEEAVIPAGEEVIIAPGLVDMQVNGFAGIDLNSMPLAPSLVRDLAVRLWGEGITTFFPTIITNSTDNIFHAVRSIAEACRLYPEVAASVGGIHLEGPFISPEDGPRGAHPAEHVTAPDFDLLTLWQEACRGMIKIVTLSPEWPQATDFIKKCTAAGVIAAIGHTAASPENIREAVAAGATLSTHLGNASHQMLPRHRNYIWEQLAADELYVTMIADGFHLPDSMMKVMLRVKQTKALLVSDATRFAGMAPGDYSTHIGGEVTLLPSGKLHLKGKPDVLAGSGLSLLHCVNTLINKGIVPAYLAWEMASIRPSSLFAAGDRQPFATGSQADMVMLKQGEKGYTLLSTIKAGKKVFESKI